jgi:acetoin utilization protein AcuB
MLVESVMTRSVVTTEPHASARSAEAQMREGRFRHLPVVAHGRVVGIVSDRDVMGRDRQRIGEVMRAPVISVTPDTAVEVAAHLMSENKIGALPVLGTGAAQLLGIVSQTDLFDILALLLGGDGPSTRLELRLVDLPRQLAQLTALAYEVGVPITSLGNRASERPPGSTRGGANRDHAARTLRPRPASGRHRREPARGAPVTARRRCLTMAPAAIFCSAWQQRLLGWPQKIARLPRRQEERRRG